jgi:hypothetical protein
MSNGDDEVRSGTKPRACATCGGQGKIRHVQGFFTLERTCPSCHGSGQVIAPCRTPRRAELRACWRGGTAGGGNSSPYLLRRLARARDTAQLAGMPPGRCVTAGGGGTIRPVRAAGLD